MRRPSSSLLQGYFFIQILLILLAVKWRYWQATIPWKRQPTRWRVRVHCRRPWGHQNRSKKQRWGESRRSRCVIWNSCCCWLFPCDGWTVVVLDIGSFTRHRIIKVSGASRTCAHLGSWIGWILLISLFLCHKMLTQKFNSFIDRSGIRKERREILVLGVFVYVSKVRVIPEGRLVMIFNWYTNFFAIEFQLIYFADPAPPDIVSGHTSKG
jgi:hypothetical protein